MFISLSLVEVIRWPIPVVIPPTPPRIAVNSKLNLLFRLEDAIGQSQIPFWINASAFLETKDNVKAVISGQTDNIVLAKSLY